MNEILRVKFVEPFKDGMVYSRRIKIGEVLDLDRTTYEKIKQSGGVMEVIERVVPNPKKVKANEPSNP